MLLELVLQAVIPRLFTSGIFFSEDLFGHEIFVQP